MLKYNILKIAFKTNSTIGKLLNEKQEMNPYEQSGIYKITCQSCHKVYVSQTDRNLITIHGHKEHIRNIRFNKGDSAFAQHILNKRHQYGPMTEMMEMVEHAEKGNLMNIKENFHTYHFNKLNKLIKEQKLIKESDNQNSMFDIIIKYQYTPTQTS
jgi:hypothetical protein